MVTIESKTYLTFDDVLIQPRYSNIETRESVDTSTEIAGLSLRVPIISANMDYVTGPNMMRAMFNAGGAGILHRFEDWRTQREHIDLLRSEGVPIWFSIGSRDIQESYSRLLEIAMYTTGVVCIDVAHGHHKKVRDLISRIKDELIIGWKIIAGNVATEEGAWYLWNAGADAVKVGIGPGSVCTTRIVTGIGVPQLSAIMNVAATKEAYPDRQIIADGGIKNSGDIVKALAAGADAVMLGNLLAGAVECPGPVIETGDGRRLRPYRGQSIFGVNGERYTKEGVSGYVEEKGPVAGIIKQLVGGIRSGMSYVGARNLAELRERAIFIPVSANTLTENHHRLKELV